LAWANTWLKVIQRARNVRQILRKEGCGKVISFTGDLEDIPGAWLAARWAGCEFIPVVDDDYVTQWTEPHKRWFARQMAFIIFRKAAKVFTVSAALGKEYRERYHCICHILHTPLMGAVGAPPPEVPMGLVGQTRDTLKRLGLEDDFVLHEPVSPEAIQEVQRRSDILFLGMGFNVRHETVVRTSFPTKLTDYLVSGRPILALLPSWACTAVFLRANACAHVVDHPDEAVLVDGIRRLISDMPYRTGLVRQAFAVATREFDCDTVTAAFVRTSNGSE
jgi:glycosyltransferase involved in cell wall biosynthesis